MLRRRKPERHCRSPHVFLSPRVSTLIYPLKLKTHFHTLINTLTKRQTDPVLKTRTKKNTKDLLSLSPPIDSPRLCNLSIEHVCGITLPYFLLEERFRLFSGIVPEALDDIDARLPDRVGDQGRSASIKLRKAKVRR